MTHAKRHALRWLVYTGLTALFIGVAASADTVMLKTEAYVKGPTVHLSDIADITGVNAEQLGSIEIGAAAAPGASKRIDSALLKMRLNGAGAQSVEVAGPASVLTKTLSLDVSKEMLTEDLRSYIQTQLPWQDAETSIDITNEPEGCVVPEGKVAVRWMPSGQYRWVGQGSFRGDIEVDGKVKKTVFAQANVEAFADILVYAQDVPRGKVIASTDLRFERRALSQQRGATEQDLDAVVGMVSRDNVVMGEPVSRKTLIAKQLIKRNQIVSVESRKGGLLIRSRAQSLDNGGAGDTVRLTNPESKAEFQGQVREDGVVVVQ